jgi:chromosome segregation ATPase
MAFDASGDGKLDEAELAPLVKQLGDQIEFNNALLEEMTNLEERQTAMQEEMKEKKAGLIAAMEVADAARTEASEWQRKFKVAEEVAATNSRKLTEARVEAGSLERETTSLSTTVGNLSKENMEKEQFKNELEAKIIELEGELAKSYETKKKFSADTESQLVSMGSVNESLTQQNDEFRAQVQRYEADLSTLRDKTARLEESMEKNAAEMERTRALMKEGLEREKALEDEVATLKLSNQSVENSLVEQTVRADNCERLLGDANGEMEALKEELRDKDEKIASLKRMVVEGERAVTDLHSKIDEGKQQIENLTKARVESKLQSEKQLATATEKNSKLLEDIRLENQEHALELQRKESEAKQAASEYEEKIKGLESEMHEMHDLLSKGTVGQQVRAGGSGERASRTKVASGLHCDHSHPLPPHYPRVIQELVDNMKKERAAYDVTIASLQGKVAEKEEEIIAITSSNERMLELSAGDIRKLKVAKSEDLKSYLNTVTALQTQLGSISSSHKRQKEAMSEMTSQFVTLATFTRGLESKNAEPIDKWFKEIVKSFELLVEQNSAVKANLEEVRDEEKREKLGKLDEQSKTLMLEEEVSRLEFDISTVEGEKIQKEEEMAAKERQHRAHMRKAEKEIVDFKEMLKQYKDKIAATEKISSDLQGKMSSNGEALARAHKDNVEKNKKVEERNVELEGALKKLQREHVSLAETKDGMHREKEDTERAVRAVRREMEELEKKWKAKEAEDRKKLERALQSVTDGAKTNAMLQKQCENTKKLLLTLQQQRANLTEEVNSLKGELSGLYRTG